MNIFFLHKLPTIAAAMHCDKHVGKMLIESCQILATAHHIHGNGHMVTYKPTHRNHPSTVWARESRLQYNWLRELASSLSREFFRRYGKEHKCAAIVLNELYYPPPAMFNMPSTWRDPALAMPDEYKTADHVNAYRDFYVSKAVRMPMLYYRGKHTPPTWFVDRINDILATVNNILTSEPQHV